MRESLLGEILELSAHWKAMEMDGGGSGSCQSAIDESDDEIEVIDASQAKRETAERIRRQLATWGEGYGKQRRVNPQKQGAGEPIEIHDSDDEAQAIESPNRAGGQAVDKQR